MAGGVGGYVATGTLKGAAAGAVGGAVVGFVMPTASGAAGSALAVGTAGLASATGQLSGQAFENVSNGQPIAANLSVDGPATALAAATGPAGGSLRAGASRTVSPIRGQVIGSQHGAQTLNRGPGNTIGAGLEGGLAGAAELVLGCAGIIRVIRFAIPVADMMHRPVFIITARVIMTRIWAASCPPTRSAMKTSGTFMHTSAMIRSMQPIQVGREPGLKSEFTGLEELQDFSDKAMLLFNTPIRKRVRLALEPRISKLVHL